MRFLVYLPAKESSYTCEPHNHRCKCGSRCPRVLNSAKGEANKETREAAYEENSTGPVSLLELLRNRKLCCGIQANKVGGNDEPNTTKWVVDVEAPIEC